MGTARVDMYIYLTRACRVSSTYSRIISRWSSLGRSKYSYLKLDLSLGDVLLAAAAAGDLLGLSKLRTDSLSFGKT